MKYAVWYMRPEHFPKGIMGHAACRETGDVPDPRNLDRTHVLLFEEREATDLEDLYAKMQGEVWSPNGEARGLIISKGLRHTSMSVGDVAVDERGACTSWTTSAGERCSVRPVLEKKRAARGRP